MSIHRVNILRSDLGDCSNHGITSPDMSADRSFYVITNPGDKEKVEDLWVKSSRRGSKPVCLLLQEKNGYKSVVPTHINGYGISGGNFVYSCDSHFRSNVSQYPIAVHDRIE